MNPTSLSSYNNTISPPFFTDNNSNNTVTTQNNTNVGNSQVNEDIEFTDFVDTTSSDFETTNASFKQESFVSSQPIPSGEPPKATQVHNYQQI